MTEGDIQRGYLYNLVGVRVYEISSEKEDTRFIIQEDPLLAIGIVAIISNDLDIYDNKLYEVHDHYSLSLFPKILYKSKRGIYFKRKMSNGNKKNVYLTEEDLSFLSLKYPELDLYTFKIRDIKKW